MKTKIIEVTNQWNWGKFMVGIFTPDDFRVPSEIGQHASILRARGWDDEHFWLLDLETGEGACFRHGGMPHADLEKHKVWVCPLYECFLAWLYKQDFLHDLDKLPCKVELTAEETKGHTAMYGYRRPGTGEDATPTKTPPDIIDGDARNLP